METIRCPACNHTFAPGSHPTPECPSCGTTVHRSTLAAFVDPNPPTVPKNRNRKKDQ